VDYFNHFIKDEYCRIIDSLDYYLYAGMDEGQMGFMDAAAAGVKTIVTAQGYHLDAENAISHPFTTYEELREIFLKLQNDRSQLVNSVSAWTWNDYALKHLGLWEYLLGNKNVRSPYKDGLNSLIAMSNNEIGSDYAFIKNKTKELRRAKLLHQFHFIKNTILLLKNKKISFICLLSKMFKKTLLGKSQQNR
jgi:hypothetical protein